MICIAAFVIFLAIWLFTPFLRLVGQKNLADQISALFKKSLDCFTRRATFKACDSNFGDEIKNSILSKLIVRHKKWVKPVSIGIEVASILIVVISIWSLLTVVKSGLSLWVFGTCDVRKPDACSLSATEACSIDAVNSGNPVSDWFWEWGEIFNGIPAKLTTFKAEDFVPEKGLPHGFRELTPKELEESTRLGAPIDPPEVAVDFFDPGCVICRRSFEAQKSSGFFEKYKTYLVPYVIRGEGKDKFENSDLIARYIEAVRGSQPENGAKIAPEWLIVENLFTKKDQDGVVWQEVFNGVTLKAASNQKTEEILQGWLRESGFSSEQIAQIAARAKSNEISKKLDFNRQIVEEKIKTKRIPTMIFNNRRHEGLYKPQN